MWTLIIFSIVTDMDDYGIRHTMYDEYKTREACLIEASVLEATFEEKEITLCYFDDE